MDKQKATTVYAIDPSLIDVMPGFNARVDFGNIDELAEQIKENGLMQPLTVIPKVVNGVERYTLIDGERRYRALSKLLDAGIDVGPVRAFIVEETQTQEDLLTRQVMLNEGKSFTDYELATLCKRMRDELHLKNSEIARRLGKNPGHVTYLLDMFCWDPRVQQMVKDGDVSIMSAQRVFKAARAKYGKDSDYETKAAQELLKAKAERDRIQNQVMGDQPIVKETPVQPLNDRQEPKVEEEPAKPKKQPAPKKVKRVSPNDSDLYTDVKDTKDFKCGMDAVVRTTKYFKSQYGIEGLKINILDMYKTLEKNPKMTLGEYIRAKCEEVVAQNKGTGVAQASAEK